MYSLPLCFYFFLLFFLITSTFFDKKKCIKYKGGVLDE